MAATAASGMMRAHMAHTLQQIDDDPTTIAFGVHETSLGTCVVGVTDTHICYLALIEPAEEGRAERQLARVWARARLVRDDAKTRLVAALLNDAARDGLSLSLLVRGTDFELAVWQALMEVPHGSTVTYAELARRVGRPSAVRAVGNACNKNHIAVLIPCHRAVRSDGRSGNYRFGASKKALLLAGEARRIAMEARVSAARIPSGA